MDTEHDAPTSNGDGSLQGLSVRGNANHGTYNNKVSILSRVAPCCLAAMYQGGSNFKRES
jgi:hypothetical protein